MDELRVDHLVYAVPELEAGVREIEKKLGVRAAPGGRHEGLGTHNALLALGDTAYLEIIAPDPSQPEPARPRPFGVDRLRSGKLVTWAGHAPDLEARVAAARAAGFDPRPVLAMTRARPDGVRLSWRLTLRAEPAGDGLVPFLIDWGATPSPARTSPRGATLLELCGEHPAPDAVARALAALGSSLRVERGREPVLRARISTPGGAVVELA
jgi:hypothetical protein